MFDILPRTLKTKVSWSQPLLKISDGKAYISWQTAARTGDHFVTLALIHVAADAYTNLLGPCSLDQLQDF